MIQEFVNIFTVISIPALIMFIVGIVLLIVEMFIPGFGIAGVTGIVLLILAAVFQAQTFEQGLILIVLVAIIIGAAAIVFFKSASKGAIHRSDMVLKEHSAKQEYKQTLQPGDIGTALTILRPAGSAMFNGTRYDVISQGDFISTDTPVKVISVEGNKIVVMKVPN